MNALKQMFTAPSAEVLAQRELEDAKRLLLESQSARDYADSMTRYHEARIRRLAHYLDKKDTANV